MKHLLEIPSPRSGPRELLQYSEPGDLRAYMSWNGQVTPGQKAFVALGHSFASAEDKEDQAKQLCQHYLEQKVSGIFFAPLEFSLHRKQVNREILGDLDQANIPVVLLDRCGLTFPSAGRHDLVGLDNRRAGTSLSNTFSNSVQET